MTPYGLYVVSTYLSGGTLAHGITYERVCYLYMCLYLKKGCYIFIHGNNRDSRLLVLFLGG